MKPYYQDEWVTIYCGDALGILPELPNDSVDLLATDPPYGIGFMGKDWDKALPNKKTWAECFRVLKAGAFAFVMSIPRADCLSRMIIALEDAGFWVNFTPIFWAYASGFPKAQNIGKAVDKRLGTYKEGKPTINARFSQRETEQGSFSHSKVTRELEAQSPQAKALDGSYGGFQPKPAVEVIIVAMKPLSEKTFVDQALKNGKGITWLDDGRIPYESEPKNKTRRNKNTASILEKGFEGNPKEIELNMAGRFPANLLVSDDVLNDKQNHLGGYRKNPSTNKTTWFGDASGKHIEGERGYPDSGSFSRYFDLDKFLEGLLDKLKSKAYNKDKNIGGNTLWEVSQADEQNGLKNNGICASGASSNSKITKAIESNKNITSVPNPAMPTSDLADPSLDVKYAKEKLSYTETDIAQRLAQIKQDTETLLETITKNNEIPIGQKQHSLLSQSVANYVVSKLQNLRDIIQTIISQPKLFGSVIPAIIEQMRQDLSQDQLWQNFWQERVKLLSESQQRTFPFAIISKASKSEKNKGLDMAQGQYSGRFNNAGEWKQMEVLRAKNLHPTVKPLKLMSYLITLGSRAGDVVLDPFSGSGTTALACKLLGRKCIAIEIKREYCEISVNRLSQSVMRLNV